MITPFHFEEDAVIHSEQNRIIEPTDDRIVEDSEGSYHISENEPKRQPVEERHETGIGNDSQSQLSGSQKSDLPEDKREETKNDDTNMELQSPLPDRIQTGLVKSNFFREGEGMIVANKATNVYSQVVFGRKGKWLTLDAGDNTITCTVTGNAAQDATILFEYYERYA